MRTNEFEHILRLARTIEELTLKSKWLFIVCIVALNPAHASVGLQTIAQNAPQNGAQIGTIEPIPPMEKTGEAILQTEPDTLANCSTQTFDTSAMGPVRNQRGTTPRLAPRRPTPRRDQIERDSEWCFAFSAADLASYFAGQRISAAALAMTYYGQSIRQIQASARTLPRLGWSDRALNATIAEGFFCTERSVRSDGLPSLFDPNGISTVMHFLQRPANFSRDSCTPGSTAARSAFTTLSEARISEIVAAAAPLPAWRQLQIAACERVAPPFTRDRIATEKDPRLATRALDSGLESGSPVVVAFDVGALQGKPSENEHSAIVVGRRFRDGKCEYRVRDSYGTSCVEFFRSRCEQGYVWLSREELRPAIKESISIRPDGSNRPPRPRL